MTDSANPTAFTIRADGRPGLYEGECAACGWMPFVAMPKDEVIRLLGEHYLRDHLAYTTCDECGQPVPTLELRQQVVEGGAGIAKGHRSCIEAEWGPIQDSQK